MASLRSIYQSPKLISLSSQNGSITLSQKNPLTFYSFSLIFFNPVVNLTIQLYDINGNLSTEIPVSQSAILTVKNADYSMIKWNDTNSYTVTGWTQEILPQTQEQIDQLLSDFSYSLVPVGNVIITSPLDSNGNIKTSVQSAIPFRIPLNAEGFTQTLTTANTSQPFDSGTAYNFIFVVNTSSTSDTIKVGSSTVQAIPVAVGQVLFIDVHEAPVNLASFYWIGATATSDSIAVIYV